MYAVTVHIQCKGKRVKLTYVRSLVDIVTDDKCYFKSISIPAAKRLTRYNVLTLQKVLHHILK